MTSSSPPGDLDLDGVLDGRIALVTGASGGIGSAIALRLAAAGCDVAVAYGRHREDADAVARGVSGRGRRSVVLEADLAQPAASSGLVARVEDALGAVDVLVANAGTGPRLSWRDVDLDTWQQTLAVNTTAPFLLAQRALPGMVERRFGRVLFVSSVAAWTGGIVGPHYTASKAALHGLTHSLAGAVAGDGVTVNALAPALVEGTRMLPRHDPERPSALPAAIPVGRLGRPAEVADLALAVLRNGYLTSKVVGLDGGLYPT